METKLQYIKSKARAKSLGQHELSNHETNNLDSDDLNLEPEDEDEDEDEIPPEPLISDSSADSYMMRPPEQPKPSHLPQHHVFHSQQPYEQSHQTSSPSSSSSQDHSVQLIPSEETKSNHHPIYSQKPSPVKYNQRSPLPNPNIPKPPTKAPTYKQTQINPHQRIKRIQKKKTWRKDPRYKYDEATGLFSTYETEAHWESRKEMYRAIHEVKNQERDRMIAEAREAISKPTVERHVIHIHPLPPSKKPPLPQGPKPRVPVMPRPLPQETNLEDYEETHQETTHIPEKPADKPPVNRPSIVSIKPVQPVTYHKPSQPAKPPPQPHKREVKQVPFRKINYLSSGQKSQSVSPPPIRRVITPGKTTKASSSSSAQEKVSRLEDMGGLSTEEEALMLGEELEKDSYDDSHIRSEDPIPITSFYAGDSPHISTHHKEPNSHNPHNNKNNHNNHSNNHPKNTHTSIKKEETKVTSETSHTNKPVERTLEDVFRRIGVLPDLPSESQYHNTHHHHYSNDPSVHSFHLSQENSEDMIITKYPLDEEASEYSDARPISTESEWQESLSTSLVPNVNKKNDNILQETNSYMDLLINSTSDNDNTNNNTTNNNNMKNTNDERVTPYEESYGEDAFEQINEQEIQDMFLQLPKADEYSIDECEKDELENCEMIPIAIPLLLIPSMDGEDTNNINILDDSADQLSINDPKNECIEEETKDLPEIKNINYPEKPLEELKATDKPVDTPIEEPVEEPENTDIESKEDELSQPQEISKSQLETTNTKDLKDNIIVPSTIIQPPHQSTDNLNPNPPLLTPALLEATPEKHIDKEKEKEPETEDNEEDYEDDYDDQDFETATTSRIPSKQPLSSHHSSDHNLFEDFDFDVNDTEEQGFSPSKQEEVIVSYEQVYEKSESKEESRATTSQSTNLEYSSHFDDEDDDENSEQQGEDEVEDEEVEENDDDNNSHHSDSSIDDEDEDDEGPPLPTQPSPPQNKPLSSHSDLKPAVNQTQPSNTSHLSNNHEKEPHEPVVSRPSSKSLSKKDISSSKSHTSTEDNNNPRHKILLSSVPDPSKSTVSLHSTTSNAYDDDFEFDDNEEENLIEF